MVVLARRPRPRLALLLTLCGCPDGESPGQATSGPAQSSTSAEPPSPTTSATELATSPGPATTTSSTTAAGSTSTDTHANPSSSSGDDTTTGSLADCGDGQLQPGEQCDLGFAENSDTGDCTSTCRLPTCGDGLVWQGHELCDAGDANNDTTWNGCRADCTPGPRCNDGTLQPDDEECDDGPDWNGSGESKNPDHAPCTAQCRLAGRLLFITSTKHTGDLGGLHGADEICQALAKDAGLDNHTNFVAWLSDGGTDAKTRIPQSEAVPLVLLDGTLVAADRDALLASGPKFGIYIDELGQVDETDAFAWTNTTENGAAFTTAPLNHCLGWVSAQPQHTARYGKGSATDTPAWWTNFITDKCDKTFRLYCVENEPFQP